MNMTATAPKVTEKDIRAAVEAAGLTLHNDITPKGGGGMKTFNFGIKVPREGVYSFSVAADGKTSVKIGNNSRSGSLAQMLTQLSPLA